MRLPAAPVLDKKFKHDIEVVVDRLAVRADLGNRLPNSISTALDLAEGLLVVEFADEKENGEPKRLIMSSKFACPVSGFTIPEIEPRLFSFNNPHGACPECDGLGSKLYFDADLVVPDEHSQPARGRDCALVAVVLTLLSANAGCDRAALQILAEHAVGRSAGADSANHPVWFGR